MSPFNTQPPIYFWSKHFPEYGRRMQAITAYTLAAYELGTDLALVPKEDTKGQKVPKQVTENAPFRCF